jgi:limonene-1,2-epoxide hydrolase
MTGRGTAPLHSRGWPPLRRRTRTTALVRGFIADWERRDTDAVLACLTDDAVYHCIALEPIVGKPALAEWVRSFEGTSPPRIEVHHQVASDRVVMNERTDHISLNSRRVALSICAVFELAGPKIRAWREYVDLAPARAAYEDGGEATVPGS